MEAAAEYLARRFGTPGELNLGAVVAALPGGRAGRRLLELLVQHAQQAGAVLTPPRIVTVSRLPETLYEARKPFADDLTQRLAWVEALKSAPPDALRLLASAPPEAEDFRSWLALAESLARLHRELAADGLDFQTVIEKGKLLGSFRESPRWQALAQIQAAYLRILDGLNLWDKQSARLFAIDKRECRTDKQIVLIATADINRSLRAMLDQVAEHVTSLILAPEEDAGCFDEHGCLIPQNWLARTIAIDDGQIEIVDDPAAQAEAVLRAVAGFGKSYSAERISVGVPDESLVPLIQQRLSQCGAASRWGVGRPPTRTAVGRWLAAVAEYLDGGSFADFAALVRCVDVERWLAAQGVGGDWLSRLDEYFNEHLPLTIGDEWLDAGEQFAPVRRAAETIRRWLKDFILESNTSATAGLSGSGPARPLDQWRAAISALVVEIYGRSPPDQATASGRATTAACESIAAALRAQAAMPAALMPVVSGAEAIRMTLEQIAGEYIAPPPDRRAVELLGWLELPLDDAPALVVAAMNDGFVPSAARGDPFLPNQLRQALGIEDHDRRWARDIYALSVLAASRPGMKLIVGRRTAEGDPLLPSRLLFACDEETIARRVRQFCATETDGGLQSADASRPAAGRSRLEVPRPRPLEQPIESMRVTEFRDYIACPYRYYLRHVLNLEPLRDEAAELEPTAFGTLAHDVLAAFGRSPPAASVDAAEIARWLDEQLDREVLETYGSAPLPAIRVQVEQLRLRLRAFADWQAKWAAAGWRIESTETSPPRGAAKLIVDGRPMLLRGRIDRIDFNPAEGKRLIIDYKTSDAPTSPDKAHRRGEKWIDLQLPLYLHLASGMGLNGPMQTAYFHLPKDVKQTGIEVAQWTDDELRGADETAADVVRGVRAERFWPPSPQPPDFTEDFAPICQDNQFRAPGLSDAADTEAEG